MNPPFRPARRRRLSNALLGAAALAVLAPVTFSCGKGPTDARSVVPACKTGPFAELLTLAMPPMTPALPITLRPPAKVRRLLEPGCIIPFRAQDVQEAEEIDSSVTEVGRVSVMLIQRETFGEHVAIIPPPVPVGTGKLYIGRGGMQLEVKAKDGKVVFYLEIKGKHVIYKAPGQPPIETDVDLAGTSPLPLPFDALVASVDACHDDQRVGIDEGGNTVEAKRGGLSLWRTRWLNSDHSSAVDTSTVCGDTDARFAWRSSAGDTTHDLIAASVRSPVIVSMEIEGTEVDVRGTGTDGLP